MGLFGKSKEDTSTIPPPPAPEAATPAPNADASAPQPPAPEAAAPAPVDLQSPDAQVPPPGETLSAPPVPSEPFGDIKNQIAPENQVDESHEELASPAVETAAPAPIDTSTPQPPISEPPQENPEEVSGSDDNALDEELFDFSGSDMFGDAENDGANSQNVEVEHEEEHHEDEVALPQSNEPAKDEGDIFARPPRETPQAVDSSSIDTNLEQDKSLQFESYDAHGKEDVYFMSTHQFKALVDIVNAVKQRTRGSSEKHLKLMDMKAEEDIEYENLRRDFQFIEDKLYELDSVIFSK